MARVLAVSGSLRRGSHNTRLLEAASALAPQGVEVVLLEGLRDVPPYDEDLDGDLPPAAVRALRAAVEGADAVLFATPEYNASVPGQLKNAIDWLSRPRLTSALWGRPAAVVGASTGRFGAIWAQEELRKILRTAGARAVDGGVAVAAAGGAFTPDGRLADHAHAEEMRALLGRLVAEARVPAAA
ncbi:MAG TPA: NAD(P)H-dependent oxidoreductase [Miltoncostaeaceae bacterium]|nr:NAD(P)H-dependent oxidoreductase [Miltoncostaeaceae bacterium]